MKKEGLWRKFRQGEVSDLKNTCIMYDFQLYFSTVKVCDIDSCIVQIAV